MTDMLERHKHLLYYHFDQIKLRRATYIDHNELCLWCNRVFSKGPNWDIIENRWREYHTNRGQAVPNLLVRKFAGEFMFLLAEDLLTASNSGWFWLEGLADDYRQQEGLRPVAQRRVD